MNKQKLLQSLQELSILYQVEDLPEKFLYDNFLKIIKGERFLLTKKEFARGDIQNHLKKEKDFSIEHYMDHIFKELSWNKDRLYALFKSITFDQKLEGSVNILISLFKRVSSSSVWKSLKLNNKYKIEEWYLSKLDVCAKSEGEVKKEVVEAYWSYVKEVINFPAGSEHKHYFNRILDFIKKIKLVKHWDGDNSQFFLDELHESLLWKKFNFKEKGLILKESAEVCLKGCGKSRKNFISSINTALDEKNSSIKFFFFFDIFEEMKKKQIIWNGEDLGLLGECILKWKNICEDDSSVGKILDDYINILILMNQMGMAISFVTRGFKEGFSRSCMVNAIFNEIKKDGVKKYDDYLADLKGIIKDLTKKEGCINNEGPQKTIKNGIQTLISRCGNDGFKYAMLLVIEILEEEGNEKNDIIGTILGPLTLYIDDRSKWKNLKDFWHSFIEKILDSKECNPTIFGAAIKASLTVTAGSAREKIKFVARLMLKEFEKEKPRVTYYSLIILFGSWKDFKESKDIQKFKLVVKKMQESTVWIEECKNGYKYTIFSEIIESLGGEKQIDLISSEDLIKKILDDKEKEFLEQEIRKNQQSNFSEIGGEEHEEIVEKNNVESENFENIETNSENDQEKEEVFETTQFSEEEIEEKTEKKDLLSKKREREEREEEENEEEGNNKKNKKQRVNGPVSRTNNNRYALHNDNANKNSNKDTGDKKEIMQVAKERFFKKQYTECFLELIKGVEKTKFLEDELFKLKKQKANDTENSPSKNKNENSPKSNFSEALKNSLMADSPWQIIEEFIQKIGKGELYSAIKEGTFNLEEITKRLSMPKICILEYIFYRKECYRDVEVTVEFFKAITTGAKKVQNKGYHYLKEMMKHEKETGNTSEVMNSVEWLKNETLNDVQILIDILKDASNRARYFHACFFHSTAKAVIYGRAQNSVEIMEKTKKEVSEKFETKLEELRKKTSSNSHS